MTTNHHGRTRERHGIAIGEGQIRRIFPVFVLAMWITAGFWIANDMWSGLNTLLALAAMACCLVVFYNFVYVFNFGYAASLFVLNLIILIARGAPLGSIIISGLLILYGIRLATFSAARYRQPGFSQRKAGLKIAHKNLPTPVKVLIFINTTTLMTFHAMSSYNIATKADAEGNNGITPWLIVGAVLIAVGLLVESLADAQKQKAKVANIDRWVDTGLFKRTRHPNYLGEIVVQLGVIVAGLGAATQWYGYAAGILAPLYIIILMLSATTGGELSKASKYGDDPEFQAYRDRSGALLPR